MTMRSGVLNRLTPASNHSGTSRRRTLSHHAHHERAHQLAEAGIRLAHRHRLTHRRVGLEDVLDLGCRDVLAASDDDVLDPPDDGQPALAVDASDITGAEPLAVVGTLAFDRDDRLGRPARFGVADEQLRTTNQQLVARAEPDLHAPVGCPSVVRTRTSSSPACAVVTVGASVEPYVRFTTAPNTSVASATKSG